MLNDRQRSFLKEREQSWFMKWVYKRLPKDRLNERERFILTRDCFRLSLFSLTVMGLLLPMGMLLETLVLVVFPNAVFFSKWNEYVQRPLK